MSKEEIIKDLNTLKDFFERESGGCVPVCLVDAIKILSAESCGDNIYNMSSGQAYDKGFDDGMEEGLKVGACDDCISRQEAIDVVNNPLNIRLDEIIKKLPSVQPKQRTGWWIDEGLYAEGHSEHAYRCSKCDEHYIGYVGEYKYCPNCGAKMEEVDE